MFSKNKNHDLCRGLVGYRLNQIWCSIKDDHRTLFDLEGVNVVKSYVDIDEEIKTRLRL